MAARGTVDSDSDSDEVESKSRIDPVKAAARALAIARGLRDEVRQLRDDYRIIVTVLASRGVILEQPSGPRSDPDRQPVGSRTARCPADIILSIDRAGKPLTLDELAEALESRYSRRTVAEYAAKMKAAGELVNRGSGYALPPE